MHVAAPPAQTCRGTLWSNDLLRSRDKHKPDSLTKTWGPHHPHNDHTAIKSYIIDGNHFRTQKEATGYVQGILHRAPLGHFLGVEDSRVLHSLIKCHPDYENKVGVGIHGFEVRCDNQWGTTRHFVLVRTDGSRTDFS